jgi:hypothetical protein
MQAHTAPSLKTLQENEQMKTCSCCGGPLKDVRRRTNGDIVYQSAVQPAELALLEAVYREAVAFFALLDAKEVVDNGDLEAALIDLSEYRHAPE